MYDASNCAATRFVLLLEFGAVLSIICVFLLVEAYTATYCYRAVISEVAKTTWASGLQTWSLDGGGVLLCVTRLHDTQENQITGLVRLWLDF